MDPSAPLTDHSLGCMQLSIAISGAQTAAAVTDCARTPIFAGKRNYFVK
jgi:hypothetical protein